MTGYIKIFREIQNHWLYDEKRKFSRYEAWLDLLMMVNHSNNKIMQDGELIEVKRGERITSIRQLMDRWDWSNTKVVKFLEVLKKDGMISFEITPKKKTLIKIENYHKWQGFDGIEQSEEKTQKRQQKDTETTQNNINKNDKNDNNEKKINICAEVINYLNEKTGFNFKSSTVAYKKVINARINEKHTLEDFKTVIDYFCKEWKGKTFSNGELGDNYLKPLTLFNTKFDERLNVARKKNQSQQQQPIQRKILKIGDE